MCRKTFASHTLRSWRTLHGICSICMHLWAAKSGFKEAWHGRQGCRHGLPCNKLAFVPSGMMFLHALQGHQVERLIGKSATQPSNFTYWVPPPPPPAPPGTTPQGPSAPPKPIKVPPHLSWEPVNGLHQHAVFLQISAIMKAQTCKHGWLQQLLEFRIQCNGELP